MAEAAQAVINKYVEGECHLNLSDMQGPEMSDQQVTEYVLGVIMVQQFSLKAGINKFGDRAKEAVTKELTQLHDMETYVPMDPDKMTPQQKSEALNLLMFLVEKRDGRIKSHACADGSVQKRRPGYVKEDSASPTVSTEAVFITAAIEAHENCNMACFDIPGAFLHADCEDENTFMLLRGQLAELMVLVDPKLYLEYVRYSPSGQAMLYVRMTKALYGMLKSALWFYRKLRDNLKEQGFDLNPYDPYVANKMVNGK